MREEIKKIRDLMESADYVTDPAIATSVHLAMTLRKPLLIEGIPKTFAALVQQAEAALRKLRLVSAGNKILVVGGMPAGQARGSNFIKIHAVE